MLNFFLLMNAAERHDSAYEHENPVLWLSKTQTGAGDEQFSQVHESAIEGYTLAHRNMEQSCNELYQELMAAYAHIEFLESRAGDAGHDSQPLDTQSVSTQQEIDELRSQTEVLEASHERLQARYYARGCSLAEVVDSIDNPDGLKRFLEKAKTRLRREVTAQRNRPLPPTQRGLKRIEKAEKGLAFSVKQQIEKDERNRRQLEAQAREIADLKRDRGPLEERNDALSKENEALKARLERLESSQKQFVETAREGYVPKEQLTREQTSHRKTKQELRELKEKYAHDLAAKEEDMRKSIASNMAALTEENEKLKARVQFTNSLLYQSNVICDKLNNDYHRVSNLYLNALGLWPIDSPEEMDRFLADYHEKNPQNFDVATLGDLDFESAEHSFTLYTRWCNNYRSRSVLEWELCRAGDHITVKEVIFKPRPGYEEGKEKAAEYGLAKSPFFGAMFLKALLELPGINHISIPLEMACSTQTEPDNLFRFLARIRTINNRAIHLRRADAEYVLREKFPDIGERRVFTVFNDIINTDRCAQPNA